MNIRINVRRYNMFVRVKEFGAAHTDLFPADSLGAHTFADFGAVIDRLAACIVTRWAGRHSTRNGTLTKAAARTGLRATVTALVRTARGVVIDNPDIVGKFRLPARISDRDLVMMGRQLADTAAPLAAAFVSHGMPATFVADLHGKADALDSALKVKGAIKEATDGACGGINAAVTSALSLLDRLDALVQNRLQSDPELLATWQSVRRMERPDGRSAKPAKPSPSPGVPHGSGPAAPATASVAPAPTTSGAPALTPSAPKAA